MKLLLYALLVVFLVPLQTTLLPHLAIWDVRPDLGLVIAALIGVLAGELDGLLVGLAIGWVLNLYSAGDLWLNLLTTGGAGLFGGLLARHVAEVTPTVLSVAVLVLSLAGGLVAVLAMKHGTISDGIVGIGHKQHDRRGTRRLDDPPYDTGRRHHSHIFLDAIAFSLV